MASTVMASNLVWMLLLPVALTQAEIPPIFKVPQSAWKSLNQSVGGRLHAGTPVALPCYHTYDNGVNTTTNQFDRTACNAALNGQSDPQFTADHFGAYEIVNWGQCMASNKGCSPGLITTTVGLTGALLRTCNQGSIPNYYIDVVEPSDVQKGADFAQRHSIPLVIKNTGHDYKGRSSAPFSLALWTHNIQPAIAFQDNFKPVSCKTSAGPALTYGAGQGFQGIYEKAHEFGYTLVGGTSKTVGASGGWVSGAGHSAIANTYGLGVDNVLQMKVVLPNGTYVTINRCQNQELFFAFRGGGGGTFGVIMETTSRVHKEVPMQVATLTWADAALDQGKALRNLLVSTAAQLSDDGWGGYINPGLAGGKLTTVSLITPKLSLKEAKLSLKPLTDFARSTYNTSVPLSLNITTEPTGFYGYFNSPASVTPNINGFSYALASRLIPRENFAAGRSRTQLLNALSTIVSNAQPNPVLPFYILMVTPATYQLPDTDVSGGPGEASVTPAWRTALWHVISGDAWPPNSKSAAGDVTAYQQTSKAIQPLRDITPSGGAYQNEADTFEPDPIGSYWGRQNYDRLLALKKELDPHNIFTCHQCVGWDSSDARYSCYPQI